MARAYPRSRGGTATRAASMLTSMGLSPLARGNRSRLGCRSSVLGPIPARAGEPRQSAWGQSRCWAYPRSRGGTPAMFHDV